jgi:hypothetical protein
VYYTIGALTLEKELFSSVTHPLSLHQMGHATGDTLAKFKNAQANTGVLQLSVHCWRSYSYPRFFLE